MGSIISTAMMVGEGVGALVSGGVSGFIAWDIGKMAAMGVRRLTVHDEEDVRKYLAENDHLLQLALNK